MKQALLIHLLAFLLASFPLKVLAFDYDVDWPTSGNGQHVLAITVNGCETRFTIKDKDLDTFANSISDKNSNTSSDLIAAARKRAANGCK